MHMPTELITGNYGQRVVIRRVYVEESSITPERFFLLPELLSLSLQATEKKPLERYAGANLAFKGYHYGSGYVLEARLTQTDIDGFHFFFDPYTKAKKILEESFSSGYTESPYLLETAKKRLLFAQEEQKKDAVKCIEGELSALGSTPSLNQTLIKAMTLEEARQAMKAIRESTTGAYCYIGKEQKKKEARIEKAFSSDFRSLPFRMNVSAQDVFDDFAKEARGYVLEIPAVTNLKDVSTVSVALTALGKSIQNDLKKNYNLAPEFRFRFLSPIKVLFLLEFAPHQLLMADSYLSDAMVSPLPFSFDSYLEDALGEEKIKEVSLASSLDKAVDRLLLVQNFGLGFTSSSFFQREIPTREEVQSELSSIKVTKKVSAFREENQR